MTEKSSRDPMTERLLIFIRNFQFSTNYQAVTLSLKVLETIFPVLSLTFIIMSYGTGEPGVNEPVLAVPYFLPIFVHVLEDDFLYMSA